VKVDFKKVTTPKDSISPKAGRTHAPGKWYAPLERFLPPLRTRPKQALDKQMQGLRKSAGTPASTAPISTPPVSIASAASPSLPAPLLRSELEAELDKYKPVDVENGTFVEDEHGDPLTLLVRHTIPQDQEKQMNVRLHFSNRHLHSLMHLSQQDLSNACDVFTQEFTPAKKSKFRDEFKTTATLFRAMAAHFAMWWGIGQHVGPTKICVHFLPGLISLLLRNPLQLSPLT